MPKKDRSSWVIGAIREQLRRERIEAIARSAAENADRDLEILADWESATARLRKPRGRNGKR